MSESAENTGPEVDLSSQLDAALDQLTIDCNASPDSELYGTSMTNSAPGLEDPNSRQCEDSQQAEEPQAEHMFEGGAAGTPRKGVDQDVCDEDQETSPVAGDGETSYSHSDDFVEYEVSDVELEAVECFDALFDDIEPFDWGYSAAHSLNKV